MKIVALIARILLGLVFLFFGLNGFFQFMHAQMPPGVAGQFVGAMFVSHFLYLVSGVQVLGGLLLVTNQFSRLGLLLLGPEIVCILAFHLLMFRMGLPIAFAVAVLWLLAALGDKEFFFGAALRRQAP
jgi:uncharacterized membrane protein YphA (DoxX/SURF4 family)